MTVPGGTSVSWVHRRGWYRVGTGGAIPVYYPPSQLLEEVLGTAKRAPEAQHGLEWVVPRAGRTGEYLVFGGWAAPETTPAGPGRSPRCPPCLRTLRNAASGPIRTRFQLNSVKYSQTDEVSPKYAEKASHSPYIQNGSGMSPLDILRFPILPAFSHKELMVLFLTRRHVYCQNDEVSPRCTPWMSRERVVRYPHGCLAFGFLDIRSSSDSARYSHRTPIY